jgi:hypothetical protein
MLKRRRLQEITIPPDVKQWLVGLILRNAQIAMMHHKLNEEDDVALQLELYKQLDRICKKVGMISYNPFEVLELGEAGHNYVVYQCDSDEFVVGYFSSPSSDEILKRKFGIELAPWADEKVTPKAPKHVEDRIKEMFFLEVEVLPNFSTIISLGSQIQFPYKGKEEKKRTIRGIRIEYSNESYDMEIRFDDYSIFVYYLLQKDKLDIQPEDGVTRQLAEAVLMELYNKRAEIEQLMDKILSSPIYKTSQLLTLVFILF